MEKFLRGLRNLMTKHGVEFELNSYPSGYCGHEAELTAMHVDGEQVEFSTRYIDSEGVLCKIQELKDIKKRQK